MFRMLWVIKFSSMALIYDAKPPEGLRFEMDLENERRLQKLLKQFIVKCTVAVNFSEFKVR